MNRKIEPRLKTQATFSAFITILFLSAANCCFGAASLWQAVPIVNQETLNSGNSGGEGCQFLQAIVVDPGGNFLLAGTDVGGIYRSLNGGKNWEPANVGFKPRGAVAFAIDPNNPDRIIALGGNSKAFPWNGLWISTDQASTWNPVLEKNTKGRGDFRESIAFDPSSATTANGGTISSLAYWVADSDCGGGLWKSKDGGNTWGEIQSNYSDGIVKVNPQNGTIYLALGDQSSQPGFYRSIDHGTSFTKVLNDTVMGLDVITSQPNNVYINKDDGVYVSTDSGQNFSKLRNNGLPTQFYPKSELRNLKVSPANPNNMLINNKFPGDFKEEHFYSNDGGNSWTKCNLDGTNSFMPSNVHPWMFAWNPQNANLAWAFGGGYISQSNDAGANFSWSNNGNNGLTCSSFFNFNIQDPNLLLMASQDYNSVMTQDGGATWSYLGVSGKKWGGFNYGGYALSPSVLFAGNAPGWKGERTLMVSQDGGNTWSNTGHTGNFNDTACGDPKNSNTAFWDNWRTTDGGSNWEEMSQCDGVYTYNPQKNMELYGAKGNTALKSEDDGASWTLITTVPNDIIDLGYDWKNSKLYIVTQDNPKGTTFFEFNGAKQNLVDISSGLSTDNNGNQKADSVAVDPVDPEVIYVGWRGNNYITNQAVRRSLDGGKSWTVLTKQVGDTGLDGGHEIKCVRVNSKTRFLYTGGGCFGIWKYPPPTVNP